MYQAFKRLKCVAISASNLVVLISQTLSAIAQSVPPEGVEIPGATPERIEQTIPNPSDSIPPLPSELPTSPSEPSLQNPSVPQPSLESSPSNSPLPVNRLKVLGITVLEEEITQLIRDFENAEGFKPFSEVKCQPPIPNQEAEANSSLPHQICLIVAIIKEETPVTFDDLFELRSKITQLYIDKDYLTSGAFLPRQDLADSIVKLQIVEGEVQDIQIIGLNHLAEGYVRSRLELGINTPLNRERVESALQLLQLNPLIERVNAQLTAGTRSGSNILRVELKEATAFYAGVSVANRRPPSTGSVEASPFIIHNNLLGIGDRFSATYGITEGLDTYDINYIIPVNVRDGTVSLRYSNSDSHIIEDDFRDLDIRSNTNTFSLSFRQPLSKSSESEFALGLALDLRRSQTFLLNDPFSFSVGPENGESKVTVLRFSQDWVDRIPGRIFAIRSQFSFGLDALDATVNDTGTDGRFFTWLGQFQWVQQLSGQGPVLLTRIDTQLTPDSLLPLERFSVGGVDTVRGYRENQLVADNGIVGSVEVRIPLTANSNRLQIVPFFQIGTVWNNQDPDPDPATIASLGLGLRWLISSDLYLHLDYGVPLIAVDNSGDSLQENGLFFSLRYQPF